MKTRKWICVLVVLGLVAMIALCTYFNRYDFWDLITIPTLSRFGVGLSMSENQIIHELGEPLRVELMYADRYDFHYDGLIFHLINSRVSSFYLYGSHYRLGGPDKLGIGSTLEEVKRGIYIRNRVLTFWDGRQHTVFSRLSTNDVGETMLIVYVTHSSGTVFTFDENDIVIGISVLGISRH